MLFYRIVRRRRRPRRRKAASAKARAAYLLHKESARALVQARLPELNRAYGFKVGRIAIRDARTRWGSCSAKGNLNFNYRIALLPPQLADYLMTHELCHIGQFDHSTAFWALVARTMPDYRALRAELKKIDMSSLA